MEGTYRRIFQVEKMITIKYIPNRLSEKGRKQKKLNFSRKLVLEDYLKKSGFDYKDCDIIVSGKVITDLKTFINNKDEIKKWRGRLIGISAFCLVLAIGISFINYEIFQYKIPVIVALFFIIITSLFIVWKSHRIKKN
jgi:hypothetical protein